VVRKETKAYGVTGRIVGEVAKGEHILFFDDVVSERLSKLEGIRPLEELGGLVEGVMIVVDREQSSRENLEKLGYRAHALAKASQLVNCLLQSGHISEEQTNAVYNYIRNA
jgi:orotate phosphoribosyltransferase